MLGRDNISQDLQILGTDLSPVGEIRPSNACIDFFFIS